VLKTVAKKALPIAGGALGAWVGGPIGAKIGSGLASHGRQCTGSRAGRVEPGRTASLRPPNNLFVSPARPRRNALSAQQQGANALSIAQAAAAEAARLHAPGLMVGGAAARAHGGRWIRQGNKRNRIRSLTAIQKGRQGDQHARHRSNTNGIRKHHGEFRVHPGNGVFNENEQMEFAAELLEITNEQEMDRFLGNLISRAGRAVGRFVSSPTGQALGGLLKGAAKQILPMAGQAWAGTLAEKRARRSVANWRGPRAQPLGLEAEQEEHEFEAAKSFVRLVGDSVKNAATAPQGNNPRAAATAALTEAAKVHAPSLVSAFNTGIAQAAGIAPQGTGARRARTGRWMRRGSKIVLFGV